MIVMVMVVRRRRRMLLLHYNRTAVVDGTASVHHGLAFMMGRAPVHTGTLMFGNVLMNCRTVMGRAALVHHRLRLVMLCAPVHAGTLLFGNVLMNRRALMSGIVSMHGRPCLMAGTAFMYRADLLCLRGTLSAGMTGRRCFGNSHQERGAEKAGH